MLNLYKQSLQKMHTFCTAYGKRCKTLPPVGHAPSGLGQYGLHPLDADSNLCFMVVESLHFSKVMDSITVYVTIQHPENNG